MVCNLTESINKFILDNKRSTFIIPSIVLTLFMGLPFDSRNLDSENITCCDDYFKISFGIESIVNAAEICKQNTGEFSEFGMGAYDDYIDNILVSLNLDNLDNWGKTERLCDLVWNKEPVKINKNVGVKEEALINSYIFYRLFDQIGLNDCVKIMTTNSRISLVLVYDNKKVLLGNDFSKNADATEDIIRMGARLHNLDTLLSFFYSNKGMKELGKENMNSAFYYGQKAVTINPDNAMAHKLIASYHSIKGNFNKAVDEFKKAIEIDSYYSVYHFDLATLYCVNGEYEKSALCFKKALYFSSFGLEREDVEEIKKIKNGIKLLFSHVKEEEKMIIFDRIFLPSKVKDADLFKKEILIMGGSLLSYGAGFEEEKYNLEDFIYENDVKLYDPDSEKQELREASLGKDGKYYYCDDDSRVRIRKGMLFFIPLEKDF